jgi:hypothetical protein
MSEKPIKASISLKADSLVDLVNALQAIAEQAGMVIVQNATVSTAIAIETSDLDDLVSALGDVTAAVEASEGVECKVSAPGSAWHGRRLDLTPMERMINSATGELR